MKKSKKNIEYAVDRKAWSNGFMASFDRKDIQSNPYNHDDSANRESWDAGFNENKSLAEQIRREERNWNQS